MGQKTVIFDSFTFTVIESGDGNRQIYQDAKGYFGAQWLSVQKVPTGKEDLVRVINEAFGTKFYLKDGVIFHEKA